MPCGRLGIHRVCSSRLTQAYRNPFSSQLKYWPVARSFSIRLASVVLPHCLGPEINAILWDGKHRLSMTGCMYLDLTILLYNYKIVRNYDHFIVSFRRRLIASMAA